jgi:aminoglycoside 2'-N-acetyltransferase I
MPEVRVRVRDRDEFDRSELDALMRWLEIAFDEDPWRPEHWDDLGPGPHVTIEDEDGSLLAHLCIAWVPVLAGPTELTAAYVEDVATRADHRGEGLGTQLLRAARPLIEAGGRLGLLGTGAHGFYEREGWVRWRGPLSVVEPDGSITPTPEEEGDVMALFVPATPAEVSVEVPLRRPRRDPEEAW